MNEETSGYVEYEFEREYWNEKFESDIQAGRNVIIRKNGISVSKK